MTSRQIVPVLALALLLSAGCSTTRINFVGPPGSVLFVDNKPHHLPAQLELKRGESSGQHKRYDIQLVTTVHRQELRSTGYLDLFGYTESDVDELAQNTCVMDEQHLANLLNGTVVIFKGQSASRQPLYELTLGRK